MTQLSGPDITQWIITTRKKMNRKKKWINTEPGGKAALIIFILRLEATDQYAFRSALSSDGLQMLL